MKVKVQWNSQKHEVELDITQPVEQFKTQLFSLTAVHPQKQKLLLKGKQIKDDAVLADLKIKENQLFMMMGTVDEDQLKAPVSKTVFLEDMTDTQIAEALKIPAGLANLGNTCYMAAGIQCLRAIPELQIALSKSHLTSNDPHTTFCSSLKDLLIQLSKSSDSVYPYAFVHILRQALPRFNESTPQGYVQQDAEEFWGELVSILRQKVSGLDKENNVSEHGEKFIDQYLTGKMTITLKCDESPTEPATVSTDSFPKLTVNIGSGVSTYMVTDIQSGLQQPVEKNSTTLGRTAMYTQTSRISRLPYYLVTNFIRFQWKASENVRAKILKRVKFPFDLDVFGCCTPELQEKLLIGRARVKELDDKRAELKKKKIPEGSEPTEEKKPKHNQTSTHSQREALYKTLNIDQELASDVGANVSGWYDLVAVLTHVGRTAESGHYVGWVKDAVDGSWWKYDDERVSPCTMDDIAKLEGGGDWHSAYICVYASKSLEE